MSIYPDGPATYATEATEYTDAEPSKESSMLMDFIKEQRYSSEELDVALAQLVGKLKPVKVELPEKEQLEGKGLEHLSPALAAIDDNIRFTRRTAQLVRALTKSLQV